MPILLLSLRSVALAFAPSGIPETAFWIYVCGTVTLVAGLVRMVPEMRREHGLDKLFLVARLFLAIPMAVFASEHFTITTTIASLIPPWMPWHTFWAYAVGTGFLCAALSIATLVQARLAAALLGTTFLIFVLTMDLPATVMHPANRFFWALALRELSFGAGAWAFAMSPWSSAARRPSAAQRWRFVPRICLGIAALFYGVENLLHMRFVPGVPLAKVTPEWIPGRMIVTGVVGVLLIVAGVCFLTHKKSRRIAGGRARDEPMSLG